MFSNKNAHDKNCNNDSNSYSDSDKHKHTTESTEESDEKGKKQKKYVKKIKKHGKSSVFVSVDDESKCDANMDYKYCIEKLPNFNPFNFQLIKGDIGPVGPRGHRGKRGKDGCEGPRGKDGCEGPRGHHGVPGHPGKRGYDGMDGETGPKGDVGSAGPSGPQGAIGPHGPLGLQGEVGPVGPQGEVGPVGPSGPQGDNAFVPSYAYIYNTISEQVAINGRLTFNNTYSTPDITYINGIVTLQNTGIYKISYYVQTDMFNQLAIFVNNVLVPSSIYSSTTTTGLQLNTAEVIIPVSTNNTLILSNITPNAINIGQLLTGTNTSVNASMTIMRIA